MSLKKRVYFVKNNIIDKKILKLVLKLCILLDIKAFKKHFFCQEIKIYFYFFYLINILCADFYL